MKLCKKLPEPTTLDRYRQAQPRGIWDQMRNDPFHGGQQAYLDVKRTLVKGQRCLCAYCEIHIAGGTTDGQLDGRRHEQRVEHFHPKHDNTYPPNWGLHWPNLWAVCLGGSQRPPEGVPLDTRTYLPPLPENLSCDAFKDHQIKAGRLATSPEGWILAPSEIPAFPSVFQFAPDGTPEPHAQNCAAITIQNNRHPDTQTLVVKTIEHLNLACPRLKRNRCVAKAQLEKQIKAARQRAPHVPPHEIMLTVARRLFPQDANSPWIEFFTLARWRLGALAEDHLRAIQYAG